MYAFKTWLNTTLIFFFAQKFGVTEYEVQRALLSNDPHDQLNIAYHLIVDNRRLAGEGRFYRQYTFNSDQNLLGG